MSSSQSRLEGFVRQQVGTRAGRETRTGPADRVPDPLALEPLGALGPETPPTQLTGPLALDPLSPIRRTS